MYQGIKKFFKVRLRKRRVRRIRSKAASDQYVLYKEKARVLVHERLTYWNTFYNFHYNGVAIRDQRTRWGSCSSGKNLNFSYRIVFLPVELQDYLIVHELCHLAEMNHGPSFWRLVERTIPEYQTLGQRLRKIQPAKLGPAINS